MSVSQQLKDICSNCGNEIQSGTEHRMWQLGRCEIFRGKEKSGFANRATWPEKEQTLKPDQGEK